MNKKKSFGKKLKKIVRIIGPGFITGASDDDPSGIGTYSQTGAQFGFQQLWMAFFTFPFMTAVQEMCGRIGLVTGSGLTTVLKKHYSKSILYGSVLLLMLANIINIGADLSAMAASAKMIFGLPFTFWLIGITLLTIALEVFIPYKTYARILKYLTISLFAYAVTVFIIKQDWMIVIKSTFIPHIVFQKDYIMNMVAVLGTTISPYLFFWQANEEVEEQIKQNRIIDGKCHPAINHADIKAMRLDTTVGMFFSNLIAFFIIDTAAATLHLHGITDVQTANDAATALKPLAGDFAFLLFAAGIIGTGLLAVPVLAGSVSYAISELFNWKASLSYKYFEAKKFYIVLGATTLVGLVTYYSPLSPFQMLYYTAVLNGIVAPPLLVMILLIANNKKVMGTFTNTPLINILGIVITVLMAAAAIAMLAMTIG